MQVCRLAVITGSHCFMTYLLIKLKVALFVRNPFEVVKQRAQAYTHLSSTQALRYTLAEEVCQF